MRNVLMILLMASALNAMAEKIYVVTADNVNVREKPISGKVVGKVGKCTSFSQGWFTDQEGWTGITIPGVDGFISEKFVKEVPAVPFNRSMLGEYMGEMSSEGVSYSIGSLDEKDGVVLLYITDYAVPDESEFRGHFSHVYAGTPSLYGVKFTHYLYPYREDISVRDQMSAGNRLDNAYEFTATGEGELRSYDRVLTLQNSAGIKSKPVTERDLFELKGNVKKLAHARVFVKDDAGSSDLDMLNAIIFSPEGFVTEYVAMSPESKKVIKHLIYTADGKKVSVSSADDPGSFSATYIRDAGDFGIGYDGEGKRQFKYLNEETGKWISEYSRLIIQKKIPFQSGEKLTELYRSSDEAPFVTEALSAQSVRIINTYKPSFDHPSAVSLGYDFGAEGMTIDADVNIMETDDQGNWTKRVLLSNGKAFCSEEREIIYY